jgi:hypothetical protein
VLKSANNNVLCNLQSSRLTTLPFESTYKKDRFDANKMVDINGSELNADDVGVNVMEKGAQREGPKRSNVRFMRCDWRSKSAVKMSPMAATNLGRLPGQVRSNEDSSARPDTSPAKQRVCGMQKQTRELPEPARPKHEKRYKLTRITAAQIGLLSVFPAQVASAGFCSRNTQPDDKNNELKTNPDHWAQG